MALDIGDFNKVGAARANAKGDVFKDGAGVVVVEELIYEKMNEGVTFVARTQVVESASKGDLNPKTREPVVPNAPGSHVGWPQKVEKHKSAAGNVKAFVLALLATDEATMDSSGQFGTTMRDLTQGKEQPGRGMVLRYSTYQQATRSGARTGEVNTYVSWSPFEESNTKEKIALRRAKMDRGEIITSADL